MPDSIENSDIDETDTDTRRLIVAITDFLRDQLIVRSTDLVPEDRDCLEIAIQCLEMAYNLEGRRYIQYRFSRPLMDIFSQVTNPVSVKDKIRADAHKEEGNNYMRRSMHSNAEIEYTNAIELDQWNAIYYCNRANARIGQNKYFEAIADCRQALMLNPDYAKAHSRMGQAYTLLRRPREAARCFRQALELEPENERYRHNLRIAENEIDRPDPAQLITNLLASMFGMGQPNIENRSSGVLPSSFMIITESHPPIPSTSNLSRKSPDNAENSQISQTSPTTPANTPTTPANTPVTSQASFSEIKNISFPRPFGVIDEGSEEQPILEFELPSSPDENPENSLNPGEEIVIEIPLCAFDFIPRTQILPSHADNNLGKVETAEERPAEKLQKDVQKEENRSQCHSEAESENTDEETDNIKNKGPKPTPLAQHCNNQSGKNISQASSRKISETATDARKKEVKKKENALDSSSNKFAKQQSETNNNLKENAVSNYTKPCGEKEENSKPNVSGRQLDLPNGDKERLITSEDKNHQHGATPKKDQNRRNNLTGLNKESKEGETSEKNYTEDVD